MRMIYVAAGVTPDGKFVTYPPYKNAARTGKRARHYARALNLKGGKSARRGLIAARRRLRERGAAGPSVTE